MQTNLVDRSGSEAAQLGVMESRFRLDARIEELLAVYGGKIEAVAAALGVSPSTVYRWCAGLNAPSARNLVAADAALTQIAGQRELAEIERVTDEEDVDA